MSTEERELTESRTAAETVSAQLAAFNAHDLEAFASTYAVDAVVTGVAPQALSGRDAIRDFYSLRFADGGLSCIIETSVGFGERWVVAREFVTGPERIAETIAIFDVVNGFISRATMLKA